MPTKLFDSDTGRELAVRRHAEATPEQRRANVEAANKGRGMVKDVAAKVDLLGALSVDLLAEVRAMRSELAELRSGGIAA